MSGKVRVTGSKVTVTYTIPVSVGSVNAEIAVVPAIVCCGGPTCTIDRTFSLTFSLTG